MVTNHRPIGVLTAFAMLLASCSGALPSVPPSALPTTGPTPSAVAFASPTAIATRPGWILLEHFGNAADGTKLADNDRRHLWLVKADGSDLRELVPDMNMGEGGHASWAPDGVRIAFDSSDGNAIYETTVDGASPRPISTECRANPACEDRYPAYSPDGKRLAFAREIHVPSNSGVIAIRDLATGTVTILESTRQLPPKNEMGRPAWSPDGKQLAYYVVPKDIAGPDVMPLGTSEIFIVNADGTSLHALTTPGLVAGDPAWSPDGSLIVFSTTPLHEWATHGVDPSPDIYVIRPDGTGLRKLTSDGASGAPSWTSDGKILFSKVNYDNQPALWLIDADGSNPIRIGPGTMNILSPTTGYSYYAYWQPKP